MHAVLQDRLAGCNIVAATTHLKAKAGQVEGPSTCIIPCVLLHSDLEPGPLHPSHKEVPCTKCVPENRAGLKSDLVLHRPMKLPGRPRPS